MVRTGCLRSSIRGLGLAAALLATHGAQPARADSPADVKTVAAGNTDFALELYAKLSGEPGNLFVSPYGISTALAMTYAGARGETAREMAQVLHFTLPPEKLHPAFADLLAATRSASDARAQQIAIANALWVQKELQLLPEYMSLTQKHYGAGPRA